MVNKDFLKMVLKGERRLLKMKEVRMCNVPLYDELSVDNLYPKIMELPGMKELFPASYPKGKKCCRVYLFNCFNSLYENDVKAMIDHANKVRFSIQNEKVKEETIELAEEWKEQLDQMSFVSK